MYDNMEFAPYEFRAFPRAVPIGPDGKPSDTPYEKVGKRNVSLPVIEVQTQEEFDLLMGGDVALVEGRVRTEDDDRRALYLEADRVGAKVDKRWSVERIASEIEAHKKSLAA
jgi:hypothetical protein